MFVIGGIISWYVIFRMRWNFVVTIMQNVPPFGTIPVGNDRARLIKFGDGGEEIFFLRKRKMYRSGYGKRIGQNKICWTIGSDGYWYNTTFGDIDKKLMEIGVNPTERDMRMGNTVLRKGIENRYNDKTFFEKWGAAISIGLIIVAILAQAAGTFINHNKEKEIAATNLQVANTNKEVLEASKGILTTVATVRDGGTGLVPAG